MPCLELRLRAPIKALLRLSKSLWEAVKTPDVLMAALGLFAVLAVPRGSFAQDDSAARGSTRYFGGSSFDSIPSALTGDGDDRQNEIPIALGSSPVDQEDFFKSFDSFMDADKNLSDLHQTYLRALIPYNTYSTFYLHSRDTHQVRNFSIEEELAMREEMARNLKNYLLVKGIPKFLATREETKGLGQRYASVVGQTEKLTKLNMGNAEKTTEFSAGLNPFLMKTWIRYRNRSYYMEMSRYLNRRGSSIASFKKSFREFNLGAYYHIDEHLFEPYYFETLSKSFYYQVGVQIPTHSHDTLANLTNYIRFTYSF